MTQPATPNSGPDWTIIGVAVATAIAAGGAAWAHLKGAFKRSEPTGDAEDERRERREDADAEHVLERVKVLLTSHEAEMLRKTAELIAADTRNDMLRKKIEECEGRIEGHRTQLADLLATAAKVPILEREVAALKQEIRVLKGEAAP